MAETYTKFGGVDWPKGMNEHSMLLHIARYYHVPFWIKTMKGYRAQNLGEIGCTIPPNEAMIRAMKILFPEDVFKMNPWSEQMIAGFTGTAEHLYPELVVQASAGASKSETFGFLGTLFFFTSPKDTTVRFVSDSIKGLRQRSFAAVTKCFNHLRQYGAQGVFSRQALAVVNSEDDNDKISSSEQKAGIFAFALQNAGSVEEATSKVIGTHWPTCTGGVMLVADEAQHVAQAWYEGLDNLYISNTQVKLVSLGNPLTLTGGLADRGEPRDSWGSVTIDDESWETKRGGLCLHLDGEKSPAIAEPDEYPFLIKQSDIDRVLANNHGRKDSSGYQVMVRGWMPNAEGTDLLIPMTLIKQFHACDPVTWLTKPEYSVAGFDPGYGGDDAVLQVADVGVFDNGKYGIAFRDPLVLDIDPSREVPVQYQMSSQILNYRLRNHFALSRAAFDESGLQRCADVVQQEAGEDGIIRVAFNSIASTMPVSAQDDTPGNKKYGNAITEMMSKVAELIQFDQVRGLPEQAAREFSMRVILPKRPVRVESKTDLKKRLKRSPDNGDACALAVWAAIVNGLTPGATIHHRHGRTNHNPVTTTADYEETNYSNEEDYS